MVTKSGKSVKMRVVRLSKRYLSASALKSAFSGVGVIATVAGIVQTVEPTLLTGLPAFSLLAGIIFVVVVIYVSQRPRRIMSYKIPNSGYSITLEVGDVFDSSVCVVTADCSLDCDLGTVGHDSLMGQFVRRHAWGLRELRAHPSFPSKGQNLSPGTVIDIQDGASVGAVRVLLVACGAPGPGGSETSWTDLTLALNGLWDGVRLRNLSEVAVPVIGSGFSGARQSHASLLLLLLLTYVSASNDRQVARKLRIIVAPDDFDWDSWSRAGKLLQGLGLQKV